MLLAAYFLGVTTVEMLLTYTVLPGINTVRYRVAANLV